MVMQTLICVGGPKAGEAYDVDIATMTSIKLPYYAQGEDAPAEVVVYSVDKIVFVDRGFLVLLYPELRSKSAAIQNTAILRALLRPEAFKAWESGRSLW